MVSQILDLDVGNSRTKWRLSGERNLAGTISTHDLANLPMQVICRPDRVRISCVASDSQKNILEKVVEDVWMCAAEFALSQASCAGMTNKYDNPEQLGVDRWLAAIAAWNAAMQTPCLVIDAGSAVTIDTIDESGRFLGGYIIPGVKMMQQSLVEGTGQIHCDIACSFTEQLSGIPTNTDTAVRNGAAFAVCAAVQKAIGVFILNWPHGKVHITGGDGKDIAHILGMDDRYDADMVLKGLMLALP
jgi:type III pantothenate kinase